jgi:uncharacterized membrane protein YgcG
MKTGRGSKKPLIVPAVIAVSVLTAVAVIEACGGNVIVDAANTPDASSTGGGGGSSSSSSSSNSSGFAGGFV